MIDTLARTLQLDEEATAYLHSLARPDAFRPRTAQSELDRAADRGVAEHASVGPAVAPAGAAVLSLV